MHESLQYPFDSNLILRKRRSIRRELLSNENLTEKRIAILGGSTTHDIMEIMELFLLNEGIRPVFYESGYAQYWQDAMFPDADLLGFAPDLIFIHTTNRNITGFPRPSSSLEEIDRMIEDEYGRFSTMWGKLRDTYHCPIIQNNFEYPYYRLMGNQDVSDARGRVNYISQLNGEFVKYAQSHEDFFIHDINYLSADYGLEKWSDPLAWYMYKYALCMDAIPGFAFSVSNIIKSIFGKNRKAFALDLDNTLWGGVIGEDGVEKIAIGQETPTGQAYLEFQEYLKEMRDRGILLNVVSKNNREDALEGLRHPDCVLKPDDFISIKANWDTKSANLTQMAKELALLPESFVFVDDNPAEREIIKQQLPGTAVPEMDKVEHYIRVIDRSGFFEATKLSSDDLKRNEMYKENLAREEARNSYADYDSYLLSMEMTASLKAFDEMHITRIAQLVNKTNQFNLTTRRYTQAELEEFARSKDHITIYGRLADRFGDNGIVTVMVGKQVEDSVEIILWLMSCRVLKRDMEYALMDELVSQCQELGVHTIIGRYCPTAKNGMVRDLYEKMGFEKAAEDENGNTEWKLSLDGGYEKKNHVIKIIEEEQK